MINKDNLGKISIIALAIVVIILAFNFRGPEGDDTISVTGMSEIEIVSDKAEITFSIDTIADNSKTAEQQNAKIANEVIASLEAVAGKGSVETVSYSIYENREWDYLRQTYQSNGYKATHTIKVTTEDIESTGDLIQTAMDAGATTLNGISFGLTKETEKALRDQALENAVEVAYEKAKTIAKAANVELDDVVSINENYYYYTPYEYYANTALAKGAMDSVSANVQPQKLTIQSNVAVVYEID